MLPDEGREYDLAYILKYPIPARCGKCGRTFEGKDAIHAPALSCCRCFYCSGQLRPLGARGPATVEDVERASTREPSTVSAKTRLPGQRPRAFWEGSKIIIEPAANRAERLHGWGAPRVCFIRAELRPLTLRDRQTKTTRVLFKAVFVYSDERERTPTADDMQSLCPEQSEAWRLWHHEGSGRALVAAREDVIKWLLGGRVVTEYPQLLHDEK